MTSHLQRDFESAVRDIYQAGLQDKSWRSRPIVQRLGARSTEGSINAEKRAVSDAARALAQLWKVSQKIGR